MVIDKKPITIRATCSQCKRSSLHRCALQCMVADKNVVKTTCLNCGHEVTK